MGETAEKGRKSEMMQTNCPARYEYAGLFRTEEPWIHPVRRIDSYEMILVVTGNVFLFEEENQYDLHAGDVMVLRPGLQHGGWQASDGETSFYWVHFFPEGEEMPPLPFAPWALEDASRLNALCRQLLHAANVPGYPAYAIQAAFALLFCEISRLHERASAESRLVQETAEWIRIHSTRRLTVTEVARRTGYHPDYLSALFRSAFQMNLKSFLVEQRMRQIRSQLLTTADSMKQIAARLDFENENQFIHYFRYHEGVSPARYRNLYHRTHLNRA